VRRVLCRRMRAPTDRGPCHLVWTCWFLFLVRYSTNRSWGTICGPLPRRYGAWLMGTGWSQVLNCPLTQPRPMTPQRRLKSDLVPRGGSVFRGCESTSSFHAQARAGEHPDTAGDQSGGRCHRGLGKDGNVKRRLERVEVVGNATLESSLVARLKKRPSIQARRIEQLNPDARLTCCRFESSSPIPLAEESVRTVL
jgi:hypothetical protein